MTTMMMTMNKRFVLQVYCFTLYYPQMSNTQMYVLNTSIVMYHHACLSSNETRANTIILHILQCNITIQSFPKRFQRRPNRFHVKILGEWFLRCREALHVKERRSAVGAGQFLLQWRDDQWKVHWRPRSPSLDAQSRADWRHPNGRSRSTQSRDGRGLLQSPRDQRQKSLRSCPSNRTCSFGRIRNAALGQNRASRGRSSVPIWQLAILPHSRRGLPRVWLLPKQYQVPGRSAPTALTTR